MDQLHWRSWMESLGTWWMWSKTVKCGVKTDEDQAKWWMWWIEDREDQAKWWMWSKTVKCGVKTDEDQAKWWMWWIEDREDQAKWWMWSKTVKCGVKTDEDQAKWWMRWIKDAEDQAKWWMWSKTVKSGGLISHCCPRNPHEKRQWRKKKAFVLILGILVAWSWIETQKYIKKRQILAWKAITSLIIPKPLDKQNWNLNKFEQWMLYANWIWGHPGTWPKFYKPKMGRKQTSLNQYISVITDINEKWFVIFQHSIHHLSFSYICSPQLEN